MTVNQPFYIYGAGGHGRVLLDIARCARVPVAGFLDDAPATSLIDTVPVLKLSPEDFRSLAPFTFIVALGFNPTRARLYSALLEYGNPASLIHPFSSISSGATLGRGIAIMPGTVINTGARIGDNCIINTGATVDHDCQIEPHSHICPGVHLAGNVRVGAGSMLGTGSSVIPGIMIGENCIIGAGSAVVRDIPPGSTAFGVPARVVGPSPLASRPPAR